MKTSRIPLLIVVALGIGIFTFVYYSKHREARDRTNEIHDFIQAGNQASLDGQFEKARGEFIAATVRDPANDSAHLGIARAYFLEGMEEAKKTMEAGKTNGGLYSFLRTRTCFSLASKSLRRVNPTNHLAKADADNILLDMQIQTKQLAQLDRLGESID